MNWQQLKTTPSDINEHLQTLCDYTTGLNHVTEFGVRTVVSTWAYIEAGVKKIVGYDILYHPNMKIARDEAKAKGIDLEFRLADTLETEIEETEFLFVDTIHTYDQVKGELAKHAGKVSKFIAFHDVVSYGEHGGAMGPLEGVKGIMPAIDEFLEASPEWEVELFHKNNNGLMIIKRK